MNSFFKNFAIVLVLLIVLCSNVFAIVILPKGDPNKYTDISEHWAYESIQHVIREGLFKGVTSTEFIPEGETSRAMVCTVLWRLTGENLTHTKTEADGTQKIIPNYVNMFWDMKDNAWYTNYISWANKNDIIDGYSKREFRPDESVSREQLAVILYNYMKNYRVIRNFDTFKVNEEIEFTDSEMISEWAKNQVSTMQQIGFMEGRPDGSFDPQGKVTRAEMAKIIEKLDKMF